MNSDRLDAGNGNPLTEGHDEIVYATTVVFPDGGSSHGGCAANDLVSFVAATLERVPGCGISFKPTARTAAVFKVRKLEQQMEQSLERQAKLLKEAREAIKQAALTDEESALEIWEPDLQPGEF